MKRVATSTPTRPEPPVNGASEHQSLSRYIQTRFDECSRSQKDVAQYIVDHLDEAAFQTAEELARRANTSSSTVVRFSQALGFEGFPELQAAAREEYRRVHTQAIVGPPSKGSGAGAANGSAPLFSLDQNEFETALAADHLNVEETARKVSRSAVEALVEAISGAEKVLVVGTDQMAFFASYLRHLLMLLDLRVDVVASPSQEALSRLGRIDEETLVIGLSAGRPHPLVVRAMKLARHRKARTAAVTDATLSEVAKLAQIKLYYSSNSPAYVRSHTALLSLIQALAYGVYARDSAQYDDRIKAFRLK
jgi:DNA-binding MurR/RpiR family transcriptional regulator